MLIDINTYIGHWPFVRLRHNTCSDLLKRMNEFGVDVSVVANLSGIFYKNTQSANEELFEEISKSKRYGNRLIPFVAINPTYADWRHDLNICIEKFGMKGIRIYPQYHDYEINDPRCIELVKIARDSNLPVAVTLRLVDKRQRSWLDIVEGISWMDIAALVKAVPGAGYMFPNNSIS